jgi:hypothetical protein
MATQGQHHKGAHSMTAGRSGSDSNADSGTRGE